MGTNYYLYIRKKKKTNKDIVKKRYTLNDNEFYKLIEESKDYNKIHIGKSSYGWNFLLCTYPNIKGIEDWIRLFSKPSNFIVDEYHNILSTEKMMETIISRKPIERFRQDWVGKICPNTNGATWTCHGLLRHKDTTSDNDDTTYDLTTMTDFV